MLGSPGSASVVRKHAPIVLIATSADADVVEQIDAEGGKDLPGGGGERDEPSKPAALSGPRGRIRPAQRLAGEPDIRDRVIRSARGRSREEGGSRHGRRDERFFHDVHTYLLSHPLRRRRPLSLVGSVSDKLRTIIVHARSEDVRRGGVKFSAGVTYLPQCDDEHRQILGVLRTSLPCDSFSRTEN